MTRQLGGQAKIALPLFLERVKAMKTDYYKLYVESGNAVTRAIHEGASESRINYLRELEAATRDQWQKREPKASLPSG